MPAHACPFASCLVTTSLAAFLARRWVAPIAITRQIAEGSSGNVRAALADLEMWAG